MRKYLFSIIVYGADPKSLEKEISVIAARGRATLTELARVENNHAETLINFEIRATGATRCENCNKWFDLEFGFDNEFCSNDCAGEAHDRAAMASNK